MLNKLGVWTFLSGNTKNTVVLKLIQIELLLLPPRLVVVPLNMIHIHILPVPLHPSSAPEIWVFHGLAFFPTPNLFDLHQSWQFLTLRHILNPSAFLLHCCPSTSTYHYATLGIFPHPFYFIFSRDLFKTIDLLIMYFFLRIFQ